MRSVCACLLEFHLVCVRLLTLSFIMFFMWLSGTRLHTKLLKRHTCKGYTCKGHTCKGHTCKGHTCEGHTCKGHTYKGHTCKGNTYKEILIRDILVSGINNCPRRSRGQLFDL